MGLTQTTKGAWSGTWMGPRPIKALVLGYIDGAQEWGTASVLGSTPQHSRLKYAIKAYITQNTEKGYTGRNIYIVSDS
jgi:hypothetical protein